MRLKLKFANKATMESAFAGQASDALLVVWNDRRSLVSIDLPSVIKTAENGAEIETLSQPSSELVAAVARQYGAIVVPDFRFDHDSIIGPPIPDVPGNPSLDDVLDTTRARDAWPVSRGAGISIAIVDTGVNGARPEFSGRLSAAWSPERESALEDYEGHGTMCASIAAGSRITGGEFDGIAPEATILACRTSFYDSELTAIYDTLTDRAIAGERIVASNSFGIRSGSAPSPSSDIDTIDAMDRAIAAGVMIVFSAGNNHQLANGLPAQCGPNSIWLHKSFSRYSSVATCRLEGEMWEYSSRGPGQYYPQPGTSAKPDFTAPTPRNGRVLYGNSVQVLSSGWGTSGACPQVAALFALLRSKRPMASSQEVVQHAKANCRLLPNFSATCQGSGVIDCQKAVASF